MKAKKIAALSVTLLVAALAVSVAAWRARFPGERYVFMFESATDGSVRMEPRFLPRNPARGRVRLYVDELLLGPMSAECRPLFTRGTEAESCFVRDGTLYVNLSDDLIAADDAVSEIDKGMELFRKNILHNFNNIRAVEVFVAGEQTRDFDEKL